MRAFFACLRDIWPSILATVMVASSGFMTMGMLGLLQYYMVSPALNWGFPPLEAWDQSVVWPVLIVAPMVWSPAFLLAGLLNRRLKLGGWGRWPRVLAYLAVLWVAALAAWWLVLVLNERVWR